MYILYQIIWLNLWRDDELADVQTGSRLEILSQGVLTTVGYIPRKISKVSSIFIVWWYELTFISSSSYSMCSCDHQKQLAKKKFGELNAIHQIHQSFYRQSFYYMVSGIWNIILHLK